MRRGSAEQGVFDNSKSDAGVIVVHETAPASYGWTTVQNSWSQPQFDIVRANAAAERVAMEAWVQRDVAVDLFRRSGLDFEALKVAARSRDTVRSNSNAPSPSG